jgi:hypothetical protein
MLSARVFFDAGYSLNLLAMIVPTKMGKLNASMALLPPWSALYSTLLAYTPISGVMLSYMPFILRIASGTPLSTKHPSRLGPVHALTSLICALSDPLSHPAAMEMRPAKLDKHTYDGVFLWVHLLLF